MCLSDYYDGNTAATNRHELEDVRNEQVGARWRTDAKQNVKDRFISKAADHLQELYDELRNMTAELEADFSESLTKPDFSEVGAQVWAALERCAEVYIKSDAGETAIWDEIWELESEHA